MKSNQKWKHHPMTLIELMIVMAIIALIGGVVMFNLHGGMEKSKKFVTQQKKDRLQQVLTIQLMEHPQLSHHFSENWKSVAKEDPLLKGKQGEDPTVDANGNEFSVSLDNGEVVVEQKRSL